MDYSALRLKKNEERRLRAGHLWVYSNEVDTQATPLAQFQPGDPVVIEDWRGHALGVGYVNPNTLICARLLVRDPQQELNRSLLVHRLNIALSLREQCYARPFYRLVHGEGDALPGLVVDRYDDVLVAQISTAGMQRLKDEIIAALDKVLKPRCIVLRNDSSMRQLEGLPEETLVALGEAPEQLTVEENDTRFTVPALTGQKTGWFYDHRMNRARMRQYVHGKSVLDLFSYMGGWGVQAATAGAAEVLCIDSSAAALAQVEHNAALNGVAERVVTGHGDAFDALRQLQQERTRFDVVVLDPPAFIKRKKDSKEGLIAYQRINQMALQVLNRGGMLVSASCSFHLARPQLLDVMLKASRHVDRFLQIVEQGHQAPDHPVHPAIPETDYLKAYFARVLAN